MDNKLFEQIYCGEKERMSEGFGEFLSMMPIARINPAFWVYAITGLTGLGLGALAGDGVLENKIRAVKRWFKKTFSPIFQKELIAIVKSVYLQHKEEFEGLSAKVAINLLDTLVKEEYPEEYKKLREEYFKDLDLIKNEIDKQNFPSKSDKDALERVKKDFPDVSWRSRGQIKRVE